jgi:hypothetical protein
MSGFQTQTASATQTAPDPHKHVKYSLGMVLGVDDFDQEFAYLSNRDQWLARDTIGYGTVCGLQVKIQTDERGARVEVEPGAAINPLGQLIRVTPGQCAYLNDWLTAHSGEVLSRVSSPPLSWLTLYVVLCYRDCPTDPVPIPGEPCRDESEATAASRWQDDFELTLSWSAPDQVEENAVRDFVAWLRQVEISDSATSMPLADFLAAIRDATYLLQSPPAVPPSPPDFMYGSPPAGWAINTADACEYLRAALRVWVTELRPLWRGAACDGLPSENCVLLAELNVPVVDGQVSSTDSVTIHEERRPYLVHLRMLQEWMTCGPQPAGGADLSPAAAVVSEIGFGQAPNLGVLTDHYALADHTHGTPPLPALPQPGNSVVSETAFGQAPTAGNVPQFSRANHTHGTPPLPPLPQPGNTVKTETAFGLAANAGSSPQYSRADHTHGTPAGGPATGDFVERPQGLPRYFIVAAGIALADGSDPSPAWVPNYNHLSAKAASTSEVLVQFNGYTIPKGKHQYIIKAMPVFDAVVWKQLNLRQLVVNFDQFVADGIMLHVTDLGNAIESGLLARLAFVIEVSQYPELQG